MLRAGICDLRICDLEMDCPIGPARPVRWAAVRPVRPAPHGLVRRKEGAIRTPTPRPPPGVRSAASSASQRRFPPRGQLTCGVTIWRAMICRIYPPCDAFPAGLPRICGRAAARFRPGRPWRFRPAGNARFPGRAVAFPPGYPGVSAGRRHGPPRVPGAAVPTGPVPEPAAGLIAGV
jgi:hypothetical protein